MTKADFARDEYVKFAGRPCSRKYLSKPDMVELLAPAMHPDPVDPRRRLIDADHALELLKSNAGARFVPEPPGSAATGGGRARHSSRLTELKAKGLELDNTRKQTALDRERANTLYREDIRAAYALAWQVLLDFTKARNIELAAQLAHAKSDRDRILMLERSDRELCEKVRDELRKQASEGRSA
jgi:hypothetical protein